MTIDNLKMNIKIPYFAKYNTIIKTNINISCKAKSRTCNCHQLRQLHVSKKQKEIKYEHMYNRVLSRTDTR